MQGTTDVAFTVLDVLGYLEEIPVCVGYEINGEITTDFPPTHYLEKAKPVLEKLPGWNCDIRGIKKYEELPENAKAYIRILEQRRVDGAILMGSMFETEAVKKSIKEHLPDVPVAIVNGYLDLPMFTASSLTRSGA